MAMESTIVSSNLASAWQRDGFVSPLPILTQEEAADHRRRFEAVEAEHGSLHYMSKMHTVLDFAAALATDPRVLDAVEAMLGPDIMLFDVTYIVKEARSPSFVSWHQDLTYWGFSNDRQVSMWLALSPASETSGCMRMIPASHLQGRLEHVDEKDGANVLYRGQTVTGVDEARAVMCPLKPGEASFHHGWTLHASMPNHSDDRRIGFNVQYICPSVKQLVNKNETATLVRGEDRFGHYKPDRFASGVMEPADLARQAELDRLRKQTWADA